MKLKFATIFRLILVVLGLYFVFQIFSFSYTAFSGGNLSDVIFFLAGDLNEDKAQRTNFLLMGIGGKGHDGADLTDSFIVASYNHKYGTFAMLSIPRDFYVQAGDGTGMRINKIYEYEKNRLGDSKTALEESARVASEIVNLPIHYYAKIDFRGFTELVDAVGGVNVLVKRSIDDPYYPCPNLAGYCPFTIGAGLAELDGKTALQYVRSRKTTSDFDRAARQQQVLQALREKALSLDLLTSPRKLKSIYDVVDKNIETNLNWQEIMSLAKLVDKFDRQNLADLVLSDEPRLTGGLLYAPPREDYGGAAVLLPTSNDYSQIQLLTELFFDHPKIIIDQVPIEILNASGQPRAAEKVAYYLNRYGINSAHIDNYPDKGTLPKTVIYSYDSPYAEETRTVLGGFIRAEQRQGGAELKKRGFDLTVVVGEDYSPEDYE